MTERSVELQQNKVRLILFVCRNDEIKTFKNHWLSTTSEVSVHDLIGIKCFTFPHPFTPRAYITSHMQREYRLVSVKPHDFHVFTAAPKEIIPSKFRWTFLVSSPTSSSSGEFKPNSAVLNQTYRREQRNKHGELCFMYVFVTYDTD